MQFKNCEICNKTFNKNINVSKANWVKVRFCSYQCKYDWTKTLRYSKGTISNGYKILSCGNGCRIPEHRKVMQEALGRNLQKYEYVHHKNGNRLDNRLENLEIMNPREHSSMHFPAGSRFGVNLHRTKRTPEQIAQARREYAIKNKEHIKNYQKEYHSKLKLKKL